MLFTYDFSLEKMLNLIEKNLDFCGKKGMERDAEIIYYYLTQKYGVLGIPSVLNEISKILTLSSVDVDKKMLNLSNDN